jgi:hypothetical protein
MYRLAAKCKLFLLTISSQDVQSNTTTVEQQKQGNFGEYLNSADLLVAERFSSWEDQNML